MKLIKNAVCYRINLPAASLLEQHLAEILHTEIQPAEREKLGFAPVIVPNAVTGDALVAPFEGGLAFAVRIDEKIIPGAAVNAETKKLCAEWAAREGFSRTPKTIRREIRDAVICDMTLRALVRSTVVHAFYHLESRSLFVDGTKRQADILTALLVKAVGAVKSETINVSDVKGGLTARMRSHLDSGTGFDDAFSLESGVWLARGRERVTVQMEQLDAASKAITEAIEGGFGVDAIRLTHADSGVSFKLTQDFHLKALQGLEPVGEPAEIEDAVERWEREAGAQVHMLVAVLNDLCVMFDYKAPADDEGEPTAEAQ